VASSRRSLKAQARFVEPMRCRSVDRLPEGPEWEYELKFDGYRALAFKTGRRVWLMSRNERDFAPLFPAVVRALEKLPQATIIDGEIVALNTAGQPSFNLLQNYQTRAQTIVFYAFDLLMLSGQTVMDRPWRSAATCYSVGSCVVCAGRFVFRRRSMHRRTGCSRLCVRLDWRASLPSIGGALTPLVVRRVRGSNSGSIRDRNS
jgi:hypothetical protein